MLQETLNDAERATRGWKMMIGGRWVDSVSGQRRETYNPSLGVPLCSVPDADHRDVDAAVEAAEKAFPAWRNLDVQQRTAALNELASRVEAHADRLGLLDAMDSGNPVRAMVSDARKGASLLRLFGGLGMEIQGRTIPTPGGGLNYTRPQPFGVVGRILPFNHPISFATGKIAAPLIAGNTVVLKPADQTPLSALLLGALAEEVLPPGVLNIVSGDGAHCGAALVAHRRVRRIAFTGSVETGERIAAGAGVKSLSMELGGKNPLIIYPDVDVTRAVDAAVAGMNFGSCQGQSCGSNSRVFVHRDLHDEFITDLVSRVTAIKPGLAHLEETMMGPVVSRAQQDKILSYVEAGVSEGADLMTGGRCPESEDLRDGYFLEPAVFGGVEHGMRIEQDEIFGPVISVLSWTDEQRMLHEVNDTRYGLCANIWTNDINTAMRTADAVESGYVWINGHGGRRFPGAPFGGFKDSGIGREHSIDELLSYTQVKNVNVRY